MNSSDKRMKQDALDYHEMEPRGKISVEPTKPHATAQELSLAYSPGVAYPCLEIKKNPEDAYRYTAKGNLVAVITNGTAVLGLGNIGALASKPVMEGKGLLLKTFAGIDVFDIEVDEEDPEKFIEIVCAIAPTFGAINLEDIKAPECFEIERRIAEGTDIPVMHDDQHGTAIITGAALLNAAEIQGKELADIKVVIAGAGASAIACATHYVKLGINLDNIIMCDSQGIMTIKRLNAGELNEYKAKFARDIEEGDLASALKGADLFLGLSKGGIVSKEMVEKMGEKPIIFALANPTPEIMKFIDISNLSDEFNITPTINEAYDFIAMEDEKSLQPMVRGENLKDLLIIILDTLSGILSTNGTYVAETRKFLNKSMSHTHFETFFGNKGIPDVQDSIPSGINRLINNITNVDVGGAMHQMSMNTVKLAYLETTGAETLHEDTGVPLNILSPYNHNN